MGLGPKASRLLARLGLQDSLNDTLEMIEARVAVEQDRRTSIRRTFQISKSAGARPKSTRTKTAKVKSRGPTRSRSALSLEELGLPMEACVQLRMQYGSDEAAVDAITKLGLIPKE